MLKNKYYFKKENFRSSVCLLELIVKEAIFHASNSYCRPYKSALIHIWASGQGVITDVCDELKGSWVDANNSACDIAPTQAEILKSASQEKRYCARSNRSRIPESQHRTSQLPENDTAKATLLCPLLPESLPNPLPFLF